MLKSIVLVAFHTKLHQIWISAYPMVETGENLSQTGVIDSYIFHIFTSYLQPINTRSFLAKTHF